MSNFESVIESLEVRLERRLESVRTFRKMLARDPELANDLRHMLAETQGPSLPERADATSVKQTHAEKVRAFFLEEGNRWHTTAQIGRAVGISRGAVAALLYQTHKSEFERKPHPRHARMKLWRLRESPSQKAETKGGKP